MKNIKCYLIVCLMLVGQQTWAQSSSSEGSSSSAEIILLETNYQPENGAVIIDGRPEFKFKFSHLPGAINIMESMFGNFLPQIVHPETPFYLVADEPERLSVLVGKVDSVGYTENLKGVFLYDKSDGEKIEEFRWDAFDKSPESYTIIDIRSEKEHLDDPIFDEAINIPLHELGQRAGEIPTDKPIVVHCVTGFRSAIGSSILHHQINDQQVMDMGSYIKIYKESKRSFE